MYSIDAAVKSLKPKAEGHMKLRSLWQPLCTLSWSFPIGIPQVTLMSGECVSLRKIDPKLYLKMNSKVHSWNFFKVCDLPHNIFYVTWH